MKYCSTRGGGEAVTASQAILNGLAEDGGLYVPERFPVLETDLKALSAMDYKEMAYAVMKPFFTDFTEEELKNCIKEAYNEKFDLPSMVGLRHASGLHYLELFHGETLAFKDMALSILPHLMVTAAKKNGVKEKILILTATSGDTGKAALSGFADVEGTMILVFYPEGGVSAFQKKQMVSQTGDNVEVVAIKGNFDDAQTGVKALFADKALKEELKEKGILLSSANSINIGRLIPQAVYYFYAYTRLVIAGKIKEGEEIDVAVPTGNFGNILAAYYAKKLGLPIRRLLCASNTNKVLYDFFTSGIYDKNRDFSLTVSPSMDILVSGNLERLLHALSGEDAAFTKDCMERLEKEGRYETDAAWREKAKDFLAGYASEEETLLAIKEEYEASGYVIDPHTAVAAFVAKKIREKEDEKRETLVASTASPLKFARSVLHALKPEGHALKESGKEEEEWALIRELSALSGLSEKGKVEAVLEAEVLHKAVIEKAKMKETVLKMAEKSHKKDS